MIFQKSTTSAANSNSTTHGTRRELEGVIRFGISFLLYFLWQLSDTNLYHQAQVVITDESGKKYVGNATHVKGKKTTIKFENKKYPSKGGVQRIDVVGRQEATNSERARDEFIFLVMTGQKSLRRSPFIRSLWFPEWKNTHIQQTIVDVKDADNIVTSLKLNKSQRAAVHAMVGDSPIVIVHGEFF